MPILDGNADMSPSAVCAEHLLRATPVLSTEGEGLSRTPTLLGSPPGPTGIHKQGGNGNQTSLQTPTSSRRSSGRPWRRPGGSEPAGLAWEGGLSVLRDEVHLRVLCKSNCLCAPLGKGVAGGQRGSQTGAAGVRARSGSPSTGQQGHPWRSCRMDLPHTCSSLPASRCSRLKSGTGTVQSAWLELHATS